MKHSSRYISTDPYPGPNSPPSPPASPVRSGAAPPPSAAAFGPRPRLGPQAWDSASGLPPLAPTVGIVHPADIKVQMSEAVAAPPSHKDLQKDSHAGGPDSSHGHHGWHLPALFPWSRRNSAHGPHPDHPSHKTLVRRETVPHEDHQQMAPAAISVMSSDVLNPAEMYGKLRDAGNHKVVKPLSQTLIQAILAGFYVGRVWGSIFAMYMAGNTGIPATQPWYVVTRLAYGMSFTVGLTLIVILGAELFTGNCILSTVPWFEGDVSTWRYLLSLVLSWFGNLVGCLTLWQLIKASNLFHDAPGFKAFAKALAEKKVHHLTKNQVYVRGLLGNWLVDLAVVMSTASTSYCGKVVGIFIPILVFAALGFEHCIANQIMIPLGMLAGADFTAAEAIRNNYIWSTLGNFTGGAVFTALPYFLLYGRYSKALNHWTSF